MKNKIKTLIIAAVTASTLVGVGASAIHAAQPTNGGTTPMQGLVAALATKFNLNATDVQAVFDQQRTEIKATMQVKHLEEQKTRLAAAVTAGTLTQAQADAIIAKHAEVKTFMDSLKDKTQAEREAALTTKRAELKAWATANNLPEQFANLGGFGGEHAGPRGQNPKQALNQAVTNGKLTQAQADLIKAKQTEIKTFMESLKDKTQAERETALASQKTALTAWATANNIPQDFVNIFAGGHGGMNRDEMKEGRAQFGSGPRDDKAGGMGFGLGGRQGGQPGMRTPATNN